MIIFKGKICDQKVSKVQVLRVKTVNYFDYTVYKTSHNLLLHQKVSQHEKQDGAKPSVFSKKEEQKKKNIKDKKIEYVITEDVALKDLPKIETRKEIVVQGYNNAKSDEALLARLDKVAKQSTNQKSGVKVDAKSLLSQVDGEVEQTFREKVITKINKNYKEVKVALANRNNQ